MSYAVTSSNSLQFTAHGRKLAVGVVYDDGPYVFGLFHQMADGSWQIPVGQDWNGIVDSSLTTAKVMSYGTVYGFISQHFAALEDKIQRYFAATKPDFTDKPACVGYDLALDVEFDPATGKFSFLRNPPLSHAS